MSIEDCTTTADYLREYAGNPGYSHADYADVMRKAADELDKRQLLIAHLAVGLNKVITRPGQESAFIAAVFLDDAKKTYGLTVS